MNWIITIIGALVFVLTMMALSAINLYLARRKERSDLLKKIEQDRRAGNESDAEASDRLRGILTDITQRLGSFARPKGEDEATLLKRRFMQAGFTRLKNMPLIFYGSKVLLAMVLPLVFSILRFTMLHNIKGTYFLFFLILFALIGFYIPVIWLRLKIKSRQEQILRGFPDGLDLLIVCTEAGMGLDLAIHRVGEEIKVRHPALSEELQLLNMELKAGKFRRDALKNLATRCGSDDIRSFTTLLVQTEKFGTNVAQAMRIQADSIRTKRMQAVEELAAKLPTKLLFPCILFIFPSLFLVLIGPALIQVMRMQQG